MTNNNYYINGRVSALSTRLLTIDKLLRMLDAGSVDDAVKILYESGFQGGATADDKNFDSLLQRELKAVCQEVRELSNNSYATDYFLLKYDYINAKILMKCKYMRCDGTDKCFDCASIDASLLQQYINSDNYSSLTTYMAQALETIDKLFAEGNRSPMVVDITLDKAMYQHMSICAHKSKNKQLIVYHALSVDYINLLTMFRCKKAHMDLYQYQKLTIDGGSLTQQRLIEFYTASNDELTNALYGSELLPFANLLIECYATGSLMQAESYMTVELYKLLATTVKFEGIQPLLQYYLDKVREIDAVRMVLIAVKSGIDKQTVTARLKELYEQ